jgi:hypothetical protein
MGVVQTGIWRLLYANTPFLGGSLVQNAEGSLWYTKLRYITLLYFTLLNVGTRIA